MKAYRLPARLVDTSFFMSILRNGFNFDPVYKSRDRR
jgi:hypothetical protein